MRLRISTLFASLALSTVMASAQSSQPLPDKVMAGMAGSSQGSSASSSKPETLSKSELRSLMATASTPEQHARLARYYKAETQHYSAEARDHQQQAEQYKANPMTNNDKFRRGTVDHCEYIAESLRKKATKAQDLAQMQEGLAAAAHQE